MQVLRVAERLEKKKMTLRLTEAAVDYIANISYDVAYGARPVKRAVQSNLETLIAKAILRSEVRHTTCGSYARRNAQCTQHAPQMGVWSLLLAPRQLAVRRSSETAKAEGWLHWSCCRTATLRERGGSAVTTLYRPVRPEVERAQFEACH